MGRRKKGRDIDGILLLDKPSGQTSNAVLRQVSRLFDARKAGHTGSLDPLATGLLVACFGEATKVSGWLLDADKTYTAVARLGRTTDSADADGRLVEVRPVPAINADRLQSVLAEFRGRQQQIPPMYSALKHQGRRLHELARAGETVERVPREVTIHALEGWLEGPDRLGLRVCCSKGTYIRSLVADLGERLGCGAHVEALRRVGLGPYRTPRMWTPDALAARAAQRDAALDSLLLPVESALDEHAAVALDATATERFCHGQAVPASPLRGATHLTAPSVGGVLAVHGADGRFLGVGEWDTGQQVKPRRLLVQRTTEG